MTGTHDVTFTKEDIEKALESIHNVIHSAYDKSFKDKDYEFATGLRTAELMTNHFIKLMIEMKEAVNEQSVIDK